MSSYPAKSSKLCFKGEKKKRKKRSLLASEKVSEADPDKIEGSDTEETGFLSSTPIALSCDASGKVFGMPLDSFDNLNDVEPDDVRQVWVSTALSDTGKYSFKSSNGKYLSCDKYGFLSAKKDAVGYSEQFECFLKENGLAVQSAYEKFISVHELDNGIEIRGDAETVGFCECFRAKIQGCYKKRKIVAKETTVSKIRSKELESMTGRKLTKEEIIQLKTAFKEVSLLDIRVKHGRDKFAFY
ncbi:hypothetical protein MERGE_001892 [Pneumocystis wakefieldiae]|uniref:Uncharacterized protein n=1 Tax=Pneumocystis wakefieldiae TaxID=38082 RepID=A0A899FS39_9ASCO|nr:hypothetical protein MERGE_001892 [Pneumocystis wakefieldiae]